MAHINHTLSRRSLTRRINKLAERSEILRKQENQLRSTLSGLLRKQLVWVSLMIQTTQSALTGETIEVTVIPFKKKLTSFTTSKTCVTHTRQTMSRSLDRTLSSILTLCGLKIGSVFHSLMTPFSCTTLYTLNFHTALDFSQANTQPILSIKTNLSLGKKVAMSMISGATMARMHALLYTASIECGENFRSKTFGSSTAIMSCARTRIW